MGALGICSFYASHLLWHLPLLSVGIKNICRICPLTNKFTPVCCVVFMLGQPLLLSATPENHKNAFFITLSKHTICENRNATSRLYKNVYCIYIVLNRHYIYYIEILHYMAIWFICLIEYIKLTRT